MFEGDPYLETALIGMYSSCSRPEEAWSLFGKLENRSNIVAWNVMIKGFVENGMWEKSLELYSLAKNESCKLVSASFTGIFTACSHSGVLDFGRQVHCDAIKVNFQDDPYVSSAVLTMYAKSGLRIEYGIEPRMEHYASVVDLLGRAGRLDDAYRFIQDDMAIEADRSVWLCLLFACRAHRNTELGELAAENLLKMEPARGSNYVPLMNLYGEAEMWDRAANLRATMKERGLKKSPGCSWVEVKNRVAVFFSGDSSSPRRIDIYETLSSLKSNMEGKECSYEEIELC